MQVGWCTLHMFWAWPDRQRCRVSQVLVLPPYQRQGVGRRLLQAAYAVADAHNVADVTVRPERSLYGNVILPVPAQSQVQCQLSVRCSHLQ